MAYSTINKSTSFFNSKNYTGNGASSQAITGVDHQPDLVWLKDRSEASDHQLQDSVRGKSGSNYYYWHSNSNSAQSVQGDYDGVNTLGSDGFTVGYSNSTAWNKSGNNYVSWNWKAGTTSGIATNGETDITPSGYSFNQTSGFSIVKYTGTGTSGEGVPHGLNKKPQFIIVKRLDTTGSPQVFFQPYINTSNATKYLFLDSGSSQSTNNNRWNGWQPDTINFYLGNSAEVNASGGTYIAYVFAETKGYSKIGKYLGNGGNHFLYTGFRPSFFITKAYDQSVNWKILDSARDPDNPLTKTLRTNENTAEDDHGAYATDFVSNGIFLRTGNANINQPGGSYNYFYMAFGQSLVGSNNVPNNAR